MHHIAGVGIVGKPRTGQLKWTVGQDIADFYAAIPAGTLPSVSFVKPDALVDGHPQTSKLDLYEAMLKKVLDTLDANPALKAETALFIIFDEGGGYYDSGFIQPLDFFW
jgi:phospholipase C